MKLTSHRREVSFFFLLNSRAFTSSLVSFLNPQLATFNIYIITQLKSEDTGHQRLAQGYYNNEGESRGKYAYVKVNLDGLVVGRKVCLVDQGAYATLALQLNDMFGKPCSDPQASSYKYVSEGMQTVSGLRLFQTESEFSLVYRDREGIWRNVGDVPWNSYIFSIQKLSILS
nr:putative auxin-induced protein [Arabidopsis thaliana]